MALILLFNLSFISGLRINEIELNPKGDDSGNEWVELYSQEEINLSSYILKNYDNQTINLSGIIQGYLVINLKGQWLDNSNEKIILFKDSDLIDETALLEDSYNDNRSWQYCSSGWKLATSTKNAENYCQIQEDNLNSTPSNTSQASNSQPAQVEIIFIFDNPLEYKDEFEVEYKALNLQDKYYDIKLWLEYQDKVISEIFDENDETWYSGNYYINQAFKEAGNRSLDFKLRLKEEYSNFSGKVWIKGRIKENEKEVILDYREETLEITPDKSAEIINTISSSGNLQDRIEEKRNISVIKLTKDIKSQEIWKSRTEYIKEYAIYGFTLFCILALIILIIMRRIKRKTL